MKSKDAPTLSEQVKDSFNKKINEGYNKGVEDAKEVVKRLAPNTPILVDPSSLPELILCQKIISELSKLKK